MRELLKIMTCGSVDDGKSTLIGRLMYDARSLRSDQKAVLEKESRALYGEDIDYSLLLDGLEDERQQRITIDVAYRFFSTENRSFIIADTPGHKEYTRNTAVGASFADLAILLVDASKGILPQSRRHFGVCRLTGITDFIFAVNKTDAVGYDKKVFDRIASDINEMISGERITSCHIIPVSALRGDNLTSKSTNMPWYDGPCLLDVLENADTAPVSEQGFVLPVQRVCRAGSSRGYQGSVESGSVSVGDRIAVYPSGESSTVVKIYAGDETADSACAGEQITVCLGDEIDISRGCVLCAGTKPSVATQFTACALWLDDTPLTVGKSYFLRLGTAKTPCTVVSVGTVRDVSDGRENRTDRIEKNDIFTFTVSTSSPVSVSPFEKHRSLGEFILIDRVTHATACYGTVTAALDDNYIYPVPSAVSKKERALSLGQKPAVFWLTGLPGSGKTTAANEVEKRLYSRGFHTMILDGDSIRSGLNKNLGFSKEDRAENIRVTAETAKLMAEAGLVVIVSLVSPYRADRENAGNIIGDDFYEIYISAPPEVCAARDKKGYYEKAKEGRIRDFTGVSSPYEAPEDPALTVDTAKYGVSDCADMIAEFVRSVIAE